MAKLSKRLVVHRIFPLGPYKNIQYTNEVVLEFDVEDENAEESIGALGGLRETEEVYEEMTDEIYNAFFEHAKKIGKDITDFEEAYNNAGDTE